MIRKFLALVVAAVWLVLPLIATSQQLSPFELGRAHSQCHALRLLLPSTGMDYVAFLETCWQDWLAAGKPGEAIPAVWAGRGMRHRIPKDIDGRLGYYSFAAETSISEGTWEAARASANVALTAQKLVADGERAHSPLEL